MKKTLSLLAFIPLLIAAQAQSVKKVALLEPLNGDKSVKLEAIEKNMVRGELRKAIGYQDGYQAFARTDIDQLMKEYGFQNSGLVSESQRKELGKMSGADYICVSTLTKSDKQFYLEACLINVETGEISNPASQYGSLRGVDYDNLFQLCKDLAQELIGNVDGRSNPARPSRPTSPRPSANAGSSPAVQTFTVGNVSFDMVKVEAGSFIMGCTSEQSDCFNDESPYHRVTISQDYYIGKFEVTQELYESVMGVNPSKWKAFDRPVENVSWNDAMEFCSELSRLTGRRFTLPTEAEWEYAARGGKKSTSAKYSGSSSIATVAWYNGNSGSQTHPVGRLRANELGIYDMSGNVWEWCLDWYGNYSSATQTDPKGATAGSYRVLRGGSWGYYAEDCRVAYRSNNTPDNRYDNGHGFRVVLH